MTDYKYDVFISYERDGLTTDWIVQHFLPHFQTWARMAIREVCNRPANKIFFDKSQTEPGFPTTLKLQLAGIEPGEVWEDSLKSAISVSRCLVGIWNPPYFDSQWCNLEWESFDLRAQQTNASTIIGTSFYDGVSFPARAAARQQIDLSPYTLFGEALIRSKKYEDFQETMKLLARKVALAVRDAPPFQPWPLAGPPAPNAPPPPLPLTRL